LTTGAYGFEFVRGVMVELVLYLSRMSANHSCRC